MTDIVFFLTDIIPQYWEDSKQVDYKQSTILTYKMVISSQTQKIIVDINLILIYISLYYYLGKISYF